MGRRAALVALVLGLVVSCELANDLTPLKNGQCPDGQKACEVEGIWQCVEVSDPSVGCNSNKCVPCDDSVQNAVTRCSPNNECTYASCNTGFLDCDLQADNGCETDVRTIQNCGTCGKVCPQAPHSAPLCAEKACALFCLAGYTDCNGVYDDGCECLPGHCVGQMCQQ
jgi:hypothetical protein